jgi:penicillin-binding protein 2
VRRLSNAERSLGYERRNKMEIPWIERDHALFICFAPFHDPAYAISVIVEHGMHGATAAAPIARDVMKRVLELNPSGVQLPPLQVAQAGPAWCRPGPACARPSSRSARSSLTSTGLSSP